MFTADTARRLNAAALFAKEPAQANGGEAQLKSKRPGTGRGVQKFNRGPARASLYRRSGLRGLLTHAAHGVVPRRLIGLIVHLLLKNLVSIDLHALIAAA